MKKTFLFCVLLFHIFLNSQINLDSLEKTLAQKKGAEKVKLLSDLCWEYGSSKPSS